MFKAECKFKNVVQVCKFKEKDCSPTKCDFYNLDFTTKSIKEELAKVEGEIRQITTDLGLNKLGKAKRLLKALKQEDDSFLEKMGAQKKVERLNDLAYGKQYLEKSLLYCKRARL